MDSAKLEPPGADYKQGETRHHEVAPIDLDDPHQAALNDASATAEVPSLSTLIAIAVRSLPEPCQCIANKDPAVSYHLLYCSHLVWLRSRHWHPCAYPDRPRRQCR